jgi:phytoene dehydrogenase-like protein
MNKKGRYDVIIIGSGMGALTVGGLLAKAKGLKVLILEQHSTPGGFTHSFKRAGGYVFSTGVHYIGTMRDNELNVFNYLTDGKVPLQPLPDPQEIFIYPGIQMKIPSDPNEYRNLLINQFPDERDAVVRYFEDVRLVKKWAEYFVIRQALPPGLHFLLRLLRSKYEKMGLQTTQQYLDSRFNNLQLKSLLSSRWVDYGVPPSRSAFVMHALIENHYMSGAGFPAQGTSSLYNAIAPFIEAVGGAVRCRHEVTRILVQDGCAVGVRYITDDSESEQEVYAPIIVSDAGAKNTYEKLLQNQFLDSEYDTSAVTNGTSTVVLYAGLSKSPESLGTKGEIAWIYRTHDHDQVFDGADVLNGKPQFCFLNFPLLNRERKDQSEKYTAEIVCPVEYRYFQKWYDTKSKQRGSDYLKLKETIAGGLIGLVEEHYPGFRDLIQFYELSTPLTTEHFVKHPFGAIYGVPVEPDRFRKKFISNKTPLKNLYLTGADAGISGIAGTMMAGLTTASLIGGTFGLFDLMGRILSGRSKIDRGMGQNSGVIK